MLVQDLHSTASQSFPTLSLSSFIPLFQRLVASCDNRLIQIIIILQLVINYFTDDISVQRPTWKEYHIQQGGTSVNECEDSIDY